MTPQRLTSLALPLLLTGCIGIADAVYPSGSAEPEPHSSHAEPSIMREIDVQQLKADRDQGSVPVLFDVRTPAEYAEGHVPGAINIPLDQVPSRLDAFEPHKGDEIYLICRSGGRSGQAGRFLEGQGYKTVNVMGGTAGWANTGLPIER